MSKASTNNNFLESSVAGGKTKAKTKAENREQKKRIRMKVSGKSVLKIKEILDKKGNS
jgi:hypothetical protein